MEEKKFYVKKVYLLSSEDKISSEQSKVAEKLLVQVAQENLRPHIILNKDKLSILFLSPHKVLKFSIDPSGFIYYLVVNKKDHLYESLEERPYNLEYIHKFLNIFKGNNYVA